MLAVPVRDDRQFVNLEFDRLYPVRGERRAASQRYCDWFADITYPAFAKALEEYGWLEGKNLRINYR